MIFLVIPCYRESRRLPAFLPHLCTELERAGLKDVVIQPVDDGSPEGDADLLEAALEPIRAQHPQIRPLHRLSVNQGKGGAVYAGWDLAKEESHCRWLAFIDADGAVPADEAARVLCLAQQTVSDSVAYFAQRLDGVGKSVQRTIFRRLTGLVFRRIVRFLFDLPLQDTQCGLKVIPANRFFALRPQLIEFRFAFDVELATRLLYHGCTLLGIPIDWTESPGTTIRSRTAWEMFASLLRLRRRM